MEKHQDVGTEVCRVSRTPSGQLPAGCASFLRSLLRTLQTRQQQHSVNVIKSISPLLCLGHLLFT